MAAALLAAAAAGLVLERTHILVRAAEKGASAQLAYTENIAGGQWSQDHYSPLSQINRRNVKSLKVAWVFHTHEAGDGMETNPLVVGRVIYAYTPSQKVIALNAVTGELLWEFDSGIKGSQPVRGVAYWTDGKRGLVLAGIMNYLYCLDATTGKPVLSFGESGRIDLRKGLGRDYRQQSIVLTSPGVIFKNLIMVGGRNPETPPAPPGDIRAFDVHTGKLVWAFHTIPHPGEPGYETWPPNAWKTAGAANNWAGMVVDEQRGTVYVPTGSAVPDFYGGARVGDDLFADCLLALNATTGRMIWSFQGVHHDLWDRDFPAAPVLLTVKRNGKMVDAIAQTTKQGFVFVLNRDTGKPLFPIEERPVTASTVPGEVSSKTQPVPTLPAPYTRQTLTVIDLTDRTPEAHAYALNQFHSFVSGNGQFYPLTVGKETVTAPGYDGGAEWGGPGVDRTSGVIYINTNDVVDTGGLAVNDPNAGVGLSIYQNQCVLCHRDNRGGSPPEFPSLIDVDKRLTRQQIIDTIHGGKGRMPSFPNLQDGPLTALLDYLRTGTEKAAGDDVPPRKGQPPASSDTELQHDDSALGAVQAENSCGRDSAGAIVYAKSCAICHGEKAEGIVPGFPELIGVGNRLTSTQITDLVRSGRDRMPGFSTTEINDSDMQGLMRFLGASEVLPGTSPPEVAEMNRYRFMGYHKFHDPDGYPAVKPPWGTLSAIDLNTGKYLWKIPLGNYPELAAKGMGNTGTENYGGPIVTGGGLVVIGATVFDKKIRAFDSRTGALLWQHELPYAAVATPTTYMVDGKQYIVVAAGGSKLTKGAPDGLYVAFALP
jgi:glucose dehydrogenase/cytochrome c5